LIVQQQCQAADDCLQAHPASNLLFWVSCTPPRGWASVLETRPGHRVVVMARKDMLLQNCVGTRQPQATEPVSIGPVVP